ncbi:hypothetical protein [Cryobacterium sp. GrIS_2_6]|uniref:hypothetical protein n=1 Tax=Cryobacterium sp. GrIS_2_6 TaxID=3162785 RepID=UPI002DF7436D|nr:hypothetical protein [Cryobacterium psychrotolerans]
MNSDSAVPADDPRIKLETQPTPRQSETEPDHEGEYTDIDLDSNQDGHSVQARTGEPDVHRQEPDNGQEGEYTDADLSD